ncbi:3-hydroxybenzoate 6-hydroxylase 1 [Cyphellophora attinorum]|uniref:3-hydroxybenzoate 6-hydroxylase 1 n=1 Tax=Cyphellophora attinorum TaxID=1664694 RepID=A0A0N0NJ56_9EURO|nr:3-hydroxybenzoate 6-hydroxylase 1 [Phialophora attinorum]KPI36528.1 3-hydroxybenzoate 6-hydroxylase 1 [Phialophora attinorum]
MVDSTNGTTSAEAHCLRNGEEHEQPCLRIIIAGAGIGGLVAAIALRKQGHRVEVFEQSRFNNEVGAAIHITPNAMGALSYIGIDPRDSGAVPLVQTRFISSDNVVVRVTDNAKDSVRWQNPWLQAHRAHLHTQLREAATSPARSGIPVKIQTASSVVLADSESATVTLADETTHSADLVIGADGVHSRTRGALMHVPPTTFRTDSSAFRFIISRESVEADPVTRPLVQTHGSMDMWYGPDRKIVLYPTYHNQLLNFVCVHPARLSDASNDYNKSASKSALLETYKDFHPSVIALLEKADPAGVKVYPFFDMAQLPTFARDRLAVVGDAAHPFTPHLAQGGAMAIEDAVSLAIMLDRSVTPPQVPQRLQWYNQARFERASTIQEYSRQVGGDGSDPNKKTTKLDGLKVYDYINYGLSHDEVHASTHLLRQLEWQEQNAKWRQPISFGPLPGPRQWSLSTWPIRHSVKASRTCASVSFTTSATLLRNMFPNACYRFSKADTVTHVTFAVESLRNLSWLAGGGYDLAALYVEDVCYRWSSGRVQQASYCPVMFENLADPIITGREELGIPKVFSDIKIHSNGSSFRAEISWRGAEWATLELKDLVPTEKSPSDHLSGGLLVHKYIPSSNPAKPDADYDIMHSADESIAATSSLASDRGSVRLEIRDLGPDSLPTLHPIVSRLAELPIFEIVQASVVEYDGVPDLSRQVHLD